MRFFGSSGIRRVFDRELLELGLKTGLVVGSRYRKVVVGRDTRTSSDAMKHAVLAGILAGGAAASDAGIVPTPTLAYITRRFDAGIMITASHNPPEYNGIKLFNPDGSSFGAAQQQPIEEGIAGAVPLGRWETLASSVVYAEAVAEHLSGILGHFPQKRRVKVVVDAGGGAAAEVTPRLLQQMGADVIRINCTHQGVFPRPSEPVAENLQELSRMVREQRADIGIAHDGDADRMMVVDERGEFVPGDRLMIILARALPAGEVVTTLDASMAIEEAGFKVRRTKIGDTWVSEELKNGGDFGGEASGAWIFPHFSLCPDGIYAAALAVAIAAENKLSRLVEALPYYPLKRGSFNSDGLVISRLRRQLASLKPEKLSYLDGIRLEFADGWLLVRPSGTEPKVRITAEARTEARAQELYQAALSAISNSSRG